MCAVENTRYIVHGYKKRSEWSKIVSVEKTYYDYYCYLIDGVKIDD